jgi:hypothetical protein
MRIGTCCARRKLMCTDACAIIIDRKQKSMATSPSRNLQTAFAGPIARCRNNTHIPSIAGMALAPSSPRESPNLIFRRTTWLLVRLAVQELSIASERGVATLPSRKPERGLLILLLVTGVYANTINAKLEMWETHHREMLRASLFIVQVVVINPQAPSIVKKTF